MAHKKSIQALCDRELLEKILGLVESQKTSPVQNMAAQAHRVYDNKTLMEMLRIKDKYLKKLRDTFGEDNVVSCVIHMDEKTPHLHATVVPLVTEERKRKSREGEKKYRTQAGPRLSADDIMGRARLSAYQNTYAEAMREFGLQRGVVGSTAKPIHSVIDCRRELSWSDSISRITTIRHCISGHGSARSASMMSSSRLTTTLHNSTSTTE